MSDKDGKFVNWIAFGIAVTVVTGAITLLWNMVIGNEGKSVVRAEESYQRDADLKDTIHKYIIPMTQDIATIKEKVAKL